MQTRASMREGKVFSLHKSKKTSLASTSPNSTIVKDSTLKIKLRTVKRSVQCPRSTLKSIKKPTLQVSRVQKKEFVLSEVLQRQRMRELTQIKQSIVLIKYYNCMLMLFMMIFTSSQIIASNFFQVKTKNYPQIGVRFVDTLLKVYHNVREIHMEKKLSKLAVNVLKIACTPSEFEKKAEFICRKVTLNNQKRNQIEMASQNLEVQSFWEKIINLVLISNQTQFLTDLFQSDAERLCVKDFQSLVDRYLSTQFFELDSKEYHENTNLKVSCQHDFTVEFLLIQKICTTDYSNNKREEEEKIQEKDACPKKTACQIY